MIITSLYKLAPPSPRLIELREKKIADCKKMMGEKWLFAKPIQRKDAK
jgi:hypothetical protein